MKKPYREKLSITSWRKSFLSENHTVPCGDCVACCTAYEVLIGTDDTPDAYDTVTGTTGRPVLRRQADGACVYLLDGRCAIYERRPGVCRQYDCRAFAIAGVRPVSDTGEPFSITEVSPRMAEATLRPKTPQDIALLQAIRDRAFRMLQEGETDATVVAWKAVELEIT